MTRSVFITGGTGSVGRSLVEAFCARGYQVSFQYCSNGSVADDLHTKWGATPIKADFSQLTGWSITPADILVNNAAVNISRAPTAGVTLEDWNTTTRINLTIPFLLIQQILPQMIEKSWGRIINISSIYGLRACEGNLPYTVSKHGLSALTKTVAKEYGRYGVTTNEICPGPIKSSLLDRIAAFSEKHDGIPSVQYISSLVEEIPMGRLATSLDIAQATLLLASEESGYINGVSLPVDGGLIA